MLERSQTFLLHAGGVFQGKFIQTRNVFIKKFTRPLASTQNYEIRSTNNVKDPTKNDNKTMRLAKRIAMSGICSRREAEKMIQEEKVTINGSIVTELGTLVNLKTDTVSVNGKLINNKQRRTRVWIAHKLRGVSDCFIT
jgi:ribosomal 50S subunit-recycling heat shock protein